MTNNLGRSYVATFAHFDQDNVVDDYVLYYLKELRKVADKIVFVSDCDLSQSEIAKVSEFCFHAIAKKHGEYDFGSHKRGIDFLQKNGILDKFDHLIIANDSCYGPLKPLEPIFLKMQEKQLDCWALTTNTQGFPAHLQSYFMVFSKKVFLSAEFINFFALVKKEEVKEKIVEKYEVGMTQLLTKAGFKTGSFIEKVYKTAPVMAPWNVTCGLLENGFPFIKVMAVKANPNPRLLKKRFFEMLPKKFLFWQLYDLIKFNEDWMKYASDYQLKLIENHLDRVGFEEEFRMKIFSDNFLFFLIKKGFFRIKFLGIVFFKKSFKTSK